MLDPHEPGKFLRRRGPRLGTLSAQRQREFRREQSFARRRVEARDDFPRSAGGGE